MATPTQSEARAALTPLNIIRFFVEITAFATLALWGALGFSFPWNIIVGIGAPALAIVVWALFVSPKAVFRVHPYVRALVELLVFVAATLAWWDMGQGIVGLAFGVVAVATGLMAGRRTIA